MSWCFFQNRFEQQYNSDEQCEKSNSNNNNQKNYPTWWFDQQIRKVNQQRKKVINPILGNMEALATMCGWNHAADSEDQDKMQPTWAWHGYQILSRKSLVTQGWSPQHEYCWLSWLVSPIIFSSIWFPWYFHYSMRIYHNKTTMNNMCDLFPRLLYIIIQPIIVHYFPTIFP